MGPDAWLAIACVSIAALVALPAVQVLQRRRTNRESSAVAAALAERAATIRAATCRDADAELLERLRALAIPETIPFEYAQQLKDANPELLADAAQRLALRLKRRVAFERKML